MSVMEAARKLRDKHNVDHKKAHDCWHSQTCYFCGDKTEIWTTPRILPLCGKCGNDETIPIIAEEHTIWYHATAWEREEFLAP